VEGLGTLTVDIAYGGDSFVLVDARALGFALTPDEAPDLAATGMALTRAATEQLGFRHPDQPDWRHVSFCQFTLPVETVDGVKTGRNTVAIEPGKLDRSPTGTGCSARMAVLHARGELAVASASSASQSSAAASTAASRPSARSAASPRSSPRSPAAAGSPRPASCCSTPRTPGPAATASATPGPGLQIPRPARTRASRRSFSGCSHAERKIRHHCPLAPDSTATGQGRGPVVANAADRRLTLPDAA
jgi:hypothetical protein